MQYLSHIREARIIYDFFHGRKATVTPGGEGGGGGLVVRRAEFTDLFERRWPAVERITAGGAPRGGQAGRAVGKVDLRAARRGSVLRPSPPIIHHHHHHLRVRPPREYNAPVNGFCAPDRVIFMGGKTYIIITINSAKFSSDQLEYSVYYMRDTS